MADPFFLAPADQPSLVLVTQQLTEENYQSWSRAMKKALNAKRKLGFVTETIATSLVYGDSAEEFWNDLKERFQHGNGPRIFEIKRELMNLRQGALTVSQYFTKIKVLWEELNSYRPVQCNCGDAKPLQEFLQAEYVHCFLMGLDDSFMQIRGQILIMEPLPAINKVLSLVVQEEKHHSLGSSSVSNQLAFLVRNQNIPNPSGKGRGFTKKDRPLCSHCGLLGHTVDKYYKIHGYPPSYGKGRGTRQSAHNITDNVTEAQCPESNSSLTLNATQIQQLMNLLNSHKIQEIPANATTEVSTPAGIVLNTSISKSKLSKHDWILDSGATIHIACDLSLFHSVHTS
ncbi:uncharacterized protein LOC107626989 [Arachis ipaensis]|uniref:uncharacterized protein LOC107626989 n=1 Tax=Arachis ipaensis TaxID=130454 RepID=UPI0007AF8F08|nr:uncharacterized protein LOC107626989 [Arachis ipaensis]